MARFRNPRYAPESLERKLSPSDLAGPILPPADYYMPPTEPMPPPPSSDYYMPPTTPMPPLPPPPVMPPLILLPPPLDPVLPG